ncbi:hypothetical protein CKA32_002185 [Geitlerinema sp. FC II]|nr:hypothetical protein CKA32_002185 [Geitlerinema sp. FC II]
MIGFLNTLLDRSSVSLPSQHDRRRLTNLYDRIKENRAMRTFPV